MTLTNVIDMLRKRQQELNTIQKFLSKISQFDDDKQKNIQKLKKALTDLEGIVGQRDILGGQTETFVGWVKQYKSEIDEVEEQVKRKLGVDLETQMREEGIGLTGHYPDLRAGLFAIELNFDKWQVGIWYGPKQESLAQCGLSVKEITSTIRKLKRNLGSKLEEEVFLNKLYDACTRTARQNQNEPMPINQILTEMAFLIQTNRFQQDPKQENYQGYSRADFSYDLFRVLQIPSHTLKQRKPTLIVATKAHTRNRQTFIWVPQSHDGNGTTFSHIKF